METTRRNFLKSTVLAGAAMAMPASSYARILGANERIGVGIIGCGGRGRGALMTGLRRYAADENAEVRAVCDPWRAHREEAVEMAVSHYDFAPKQYTAYLELLENDDVDAVMIASPDHLHTAHLEAAALAEKHMYCEKPLAMDFDALKRATDAVRERNLVFQAGTQLRSFPTFTGCREVYKSGALGTVSRIEQVRNDPRPYWYRYVKEVEEKDVDWQQFLVDAPKRPFDPVRFSGWYGFRDYSDGPLPGFGSHYIDLVHYITGASMPVSATASGGLYAWRDNEYGFDCHDQVQAVWEYAEGFMVSYSTNFGNGAGNVFRIAGNQGALDMTDWDNPVFTNAGAYSAGRLERREEPVESIDRPDHVLDWLQCLRTGKKCNADIEAGYSHAVACLMAMRATDTGRRHVYDPETREIKEG